MLKKLAVPFLTLTLAAFGCSSSTTSTPGTGGVGGGAAGSGAAGATGAAGSGAAGSGAAGATGAAGSGAAGSGAAGSGAAGSGAAGSGAAGSSAAGSGGGGKAGGGGGGKAGGGGGAKADAGTSMADCTVTTSTGTETLSASVFCAQMAAYCPSQFTTEGACTSTYNTSGQQHCRSYHMCWGVEGLTNASGANPTLHCPHTIGVGLCMATDASAGN